jgi:hypothetical protein
MSTMLSKHFGDSVTLPAYRISKRSQTIIVHAVHLGSLGK